MSPTTRLWINLSSMGCEIICFGTSHKYIISTCMVTFAQTQKFLARLITSSAYRLESALHLPSARLQAHNRAFITTEFLRCGGKRKNFNTSPKVGQFQASNG